MTPDYFSGDSRTLSCSGTVALEEGLPGWFVNLERDSLTRLELRECLIVHVVAVCSIGV